MNQEKTQREAEPLVAALADPARRHAAFRALLALGPAARASVHAGLGDGRFEVRRMCVLWLLRVPDAGDLPRLAPLLRDPRAKVRQVALVAVACAHAKADPGDVVPLLVERVLQDESPRIRRQAVSLLAFQHAHPDLEGLFAQLLESETDPKLRRAAGCGLFLTREQAAGRGAERRSR